ncbi:hypothetical protein AKJ16_DCAP08529 [Drosera capensis]
MFSWPLSTCRFFDSSFVFWEERRPDYSYRFAVYQTIYVRCIVS